MWADAQRDGRLPNIGGDLCESSVIPFLVARRKFWLTPAARVPCSNVVNIGERNTWTQREVCTNGKISSGARAPENVYNVPAQETAKHRARFGWPPVSDVAVVTKSRRETYFFNWPILTRGDIGSSYTSTIAVALLDPLFSVKELLTFGIGFQ